MKGRKKIAIVLSIIILVGNLLFNPIEAKAESNIEPQMLNSETINDRMSVIEGERDVVEVESVCLDKTQASLNVGQNITLVATINPIVATNKEVAWSSSNTKIATVDNMGKVTAVGVGTATIIVATVNGGYKANCSVTVKKLPIPTSVKAASSSYKSIDVSWGVVTGASGYELYRATSSTGTYALIATTTEPSYNNTGLKTNSTYYYKNRAYTIGTVKMYSGFSTVVNSKTIPSVPASVKAVSSSYKSINTRWGAVTGASGYEVYRAISGSGTYTLITTTTATSYNNTGLKTNSTYYYKVRAYTKVGTVKVYSSFSTVVNSKPIPSAPISVKTVSSSYNSISVSWGAVTGASRYEVYRARSSTGTYALIATTTEPSYNNAGLTTNSTYYYKIRAYTTVGSIKIFSDFSIVVSSKPIPSAPTSVKAVSTSYNSINLSWGAVTGASEYEVYRATSSTGTYTLISTITATSYNNTELTTNSTYYYKSRAYTAVGNEKVYSGFSTVVSSKPIPVAPGAVKAVSSSYKSINLSWETVAGASGYEVYRATSSGGNYTLLTTTMATSYNNTGLKTNSIYYYKNRAYTTVGTVKMYSGFSKVVNAKTIPSVPASVNAVSSSYKSINISWGAVTGASVYEVYRATTSSGTYTLITTTTATSYNNTILTTNSTYYYKVRAYTTVGNVKVYSGFSTVVNSKPIPSVPASVESVSSSYNSISVSWGVVTGASGYEVYRGTSSTGTYALIATTTATSYNNAGLTTNSTYYYKIRAYKIVGSIKVFSDFSIAVNSKPIPSIPVSVKAVSASYDSVNISWGAVTGASRYEVYRTTSSTGTYTLITTITTTSYDDTGLITNNTYYYKVIACTLVGETSVYSGFSSEVSQIPMLAPTSVSLNKTSVTLGVGETTVLIATILPTNVPNKSIKWTSSNNTIAKVDSYGKVIAVGIGNAIITATTVDGNKTANCAITVHKNYKSEFQKLGFVFQSDTTALYTKNGMEVGLVKRDGFWQLATKKWGDSYESLFESSISVIWDKYIAWDNLIYIDYALEDYGSSFKSPYIQAFGKDGKLIVYIFETTKIKP